MRAFESAKKGIAQRSYMVTVLWTGSDRFGHAVSTSLYRWTGSDRFGYAVSTSLHGLPTSFTHALKINLGRFLSPF